MDCKRNFKWCKDGNGQFTTVPLKALSDQVWIIYESLKFNIGLALFNKKTKTFFEPHKGFLSFGEEEIAN